MENFRRELARGGGLSSYPHPYLMPEFWQFPTVSMGLSPIMAIYQARFNRYLEDRGIKPPDDQKVWAFLGDGETDEPESLGAITLAAREKLDNLDLRGQLQSPAPGRTGARQRQDHPGAGGRLPRRRLERHQGDLGQTTGIRCWTRTTRGCWPSAWRRSSTVSTRNTRWPVATTSARISSASYPELAQLVEDYSDEQLQQAAARRPRPGKVYAAYKAAVEHKGSPTVILAKTIKGYGLGEAGEGTNITHQQKKLNEEELRHFRSRFDIPIPDDDDQGGPFYRPADDSEEIRYLQERRRAWAATCQRAAYRSHLPACRRTPFTPNSARGPAIARWPPPWPWCTCWPNC